MSTTTFTLVIPVKRLGEAKSRLGAFAGDHRADLALAFAADTLTAALACPLVAEAVVVTDDPRARAELRAQGARLLPDEPDRGLNEALAYAADRLRAHEAGGPIAALSADLPALRPGELARVLADAPAHARAFLADHRLVGTTLLTAGPGQPLEPLFGDGSRGRHLLSGAVELAPGPVPSVRLDVDTPADLAAAVALGVGRRTSAVLASLPPLG